MIMKRLFAALLALLTVFSCIGCSKSDPPQSNTPNITGTENNGNELNNKTDDEAAPTEPTEVNQYDENTVLFACQDRSDIEGDRYVIYYYNYKGDLLKSEEAGNIGFSAQNGLAAAYDPASGLVGFVDQSGVFVIEPKWDDAAAFSDDGIALVAIEDEKYIETYGYINENGEEVTPCIYNDATSFYPSGVAIIGFSEESIKSEEYEGETYTYTDYSYKYGVIDKKGKTIIEPLYDRIDHIVSDYIVCYSKNSVDIYNLLGNKLYSEDASSLPDTQYYNYQYYGHILFRLTMQSNGETHYSVKTEMFDGNTFDECVFSSNISIESKRVATTSSGYGYGVTQNGTTVIPFEYDNIIQADSFFIAIKYKNGNVSDQVFDIYNEYFEKTAADLEYNYNPYRIEAFGENMKLPYGYFEVCIYDEVTKESFSGIIDYTGKVIVPPLFYRGIKLYTYESIGGVFSPYFY